MNGVLRLVLAIGLLIIHTGSAFAQELTRLPAEPPHPAHWNERLTTATPALLAAPVFDVGQEHWFVTQFMLGTETGIRFQYAFAQECTHTWTGELFLGGAATNYGLGGAIGVGGRVHYTWMCGRWNDAILVSPGLNLVLLGGHDRRRGILDPDYPKEDILFLAPSVDISWLHDFHPHFGWELGLHLGLGIGLSGIDHAGDPAGGQLTPLFGLYTGLRF